MSILVAFSLVAAASVREMPVSVTVISSETINPKEVRKHEQKMRRKWQPVCRSVYANRKNLAEELAKPRYGNALLPVGYSQTLSDAADHFRYGDYGCRKDPEMAIALLEHMVGPGPISDANTSTVQGLIDLYQSRPSPSNRVMELKQLLWLRGQLYNEAELGWTAATRREFLARDDVWNWLNARPANDHSAALKRLEVLFDSASPRFDPMRGIDLVEADNVILSDPYTYHAAAMLAEGKVFPSDTVRAEALLLRIVERSPASRILLTDLVAPRLASTDPNVRESATQLLRERIALLPSFSNPSGGEGARSVLVPYYAARLNSKDEVQAKDALDVLSRFAELKSDAAVSPLISWIKTQLRGKTLEDKRSVWPVLARLSRAGYGSARVALDEDIKRTGGLIVIENVDDVESSARQVISDDDYPSSAMRNEEQGTVSLKLLIAPNGRAVDAIIVKDAAETLGKKVAEVAIRRFRLSDPRYAGRYVMLTLPDVQFILPECATGQAPVPELGAIHVIGTWCPKTLNDEIHVAY